MGCNSGNTRSPRPTAEVAAGEPFSSSVRPAPDPLGRPLGDRGRNAIQDLGLQPAPVRRSVRQQYLIQLGIPFTQLVPTGCGHSVFVSGAGLGTGPSALRDLEGHPVVVGIISPCLLVLSFRCPLWRRHFGTALADTANVAENPAQLIATGTTVESSSPTTIAAGEVVEDLGNLTISTPQGTVYFQIAKFCVMSAMR